jgi:hypothetical protein
VIFAVVTLKSVAAKSRCRALDQASGSDKGQKAKTVRKKTPWLDEFADFAFRSP